MKYKVKNKLWIWGGGEKGSWHFLSIPPETARKISSKFSAQKRGWGSLPVKVFFKDPEHKSKKITLETSIFPNKKDEIFLIPIKKTTRLLLGVQHGDILECEVEIKV